MADTAFLTNVKTLRARARKSFVATELVCVLRYTMHSIAAAGINSESVDAEFAEHAESERGHMMMAAERIDQLAGVPNFNPEGLVSRSATEYGTGGNLVHMVKENLVGERLVIEHYRELIRYFGDNDLTTRVMIEGILAHEEEHAGDMHDILVANEGKPFLPA